MGSNFSSDHSSDDPAIILFDGVCNLCNGTVNFIIDHDPDGVFCFAPLQSDAAEEHLADTTLNGHLSTIVLVENGEAYIRSTAALRIARRLTAPWPLLYFFIVVPRPLRDTVYRWIARNRYDWFGRRDECRRPTPNLKTRFLDHD
ncbi:MAG: thiol-disulfide oxidoreductase DCC [Bacteroidetes bacterium SW_9_63_38]|nr:MAG: thiol-disulfide oxidoreductase DCC [Bacteroidetes bacterium SW_9_63_38]